jgi:hypothetical protein
MNSKSTTMHKLFDLKKWNIESVYSPDLLLVFIMGMFTHTEKENTQKYFTLKYDIWYFVTLCKICILSNPKYWNHYLKFPVCLEWNARYYFYLIFWGFVHKSNGSSCVRMWKLNHTINRSHLRKWLNLNVLMVCSKFHVR